jgi:hypothetical protein
MLSGSSDHETARQKVFSSFLDQREESETESESSTYVDPGSTGTNLLLLRLCQPEERSASGRACRQLEEVQRVEV